MLYYILDSEYAKILSYYRPTRVIGEDECGRNVKGTIGSDYITLPLNSPAPEGYDEVEVLFRFKKKTGKDACLLYDFEVCLEITTPIEWG